jgi:fluoride ion exporter CrcB/FEX
MRNTRRFRVVGIALVAIGGAIGSVSRYVLSTLVLRASGSLFPAGTVIMGVCLGPGVTTDG